MGMKLICDQGIKECELCKGNNNNDDKDIEDCANLAHQDLIDNIYVDDVFLGAKAMPKAQAVSPTSVWILGQP